jgi:hypothetical protein
MGEKNYCLKSSLVILIFEQKKYAEPQNMKYLFRFIYLFLVAAMDD